MKPIFYTNEDFKKIINKVVIIEVGPSNNETITEKLEGKVIKYGLAANQPHLPVDIKFQLLNGVERYFGILEIKSINIK